MRIINELYGRDFITYECSADEETSFTGDVGKIMTFFGYEETYAPQPAALWDIVFDGELEKRKDMFVRQLQCGEIEMFLPIVCGNGDVQWFLNRGHRHGDVLVGLFASVGRVKELFDQQHDRITRYKERLKHTETMVSTLQVLSEQDSLTKLYNSDTTRRLCTEYLAASHSTCALIMLDLDGFKQVNDVLGHMEGDRVITCVAEGIKKIFRSGDVVGRVGGDEFLVLMKDVPDVDIVKRKCSSIVEASSKLAAELDCEFFGCSVGAVVSVRCGDYDELFRVADTIMYNVKNNGGHDFKVISDTDQEYKKLINVKEVISP